jgi:hypothetical protein
VKQNNIYELGKKLEIDIWQTFFKNLNISQTMDLKRKEN